MANDDRLEGLNLPEARALILAQPNPFNGT
jgi:hypothetical protein